MLPEQSWGSLLFLMTCCATHSLVIAVRQSTVVCVGLARASNARREGRLLSMVSKARLAAHSLDIRIPNSSTRFVRHTLSRPLQSVNSRKKKQKPLSGVSQKTGASVSEKMPRASLGHCKFQHYAGPWTTHLKLFFSFPSCGLTCLKTLLPVCVLFIFFSRSPTVPPMEVLQDRTGLANDHHK